MCLAPYGWKFTVILLRVIEADWSSRNHCVSLYAEENEGSALSDRFDWFLFNSSSKQNPKRWNTFALCEGEITAAVPTEVPACSLGTERNEFLCKIDVWHKCEHFSASFNTRVRPVREAECSFFTAADKADKARSWQFSSVTYQGLKEEFASLRVFL
jgi:hypothetical protein